MSPRMQRRFWWHHLPFGALSAFAIWVLYITRPYPDVITRLSFATAWPGLVLLAVTLVIGPWRTLRGKAPVLSSDLRRDIGIWAGIVGVAHAIIGNCVHVAGLGLKATGRQPSLIRCRNIPPRHNGQISGCAFRCRLRRCRCCHGCPGSPGAASGTVRRRVPSGPAVPTPADCCD